MRANGLRLNHTVQIETMFIKSKKVWHGADVTTHFCSAACLRRITTTDIWRQIRTMWIFLYTGPPEFLNVDQGSAYNSHHMKWNLARKGSRILRHQLRRGQDRSCRMLQFSTLGSVHKTLRRTGTIYDQRRVVPDGLVRSQLPVDCEQGHPVKTFWYFGAVHRSTRTSLPNPPFFDAKQRTALSKRCATQNKTYTYSICLSA